jgi:hypothetical protein
MGHLILPDSADLKRIEIRGDRSLREMSAQPLKTRVIIGDHTDVRAVSLVTAAGVRKIAQPDHSLLLCHCDSIPLFYQGFAHGWIELALHSAAVRTLTVASIIDLGTSVGQYPNAGRGAGRPDA